MRESVFQSRLIKRLRVLFPDCIIMKNDSGYLQGIPDLTILWGNLWATLEVKPSATAPHEANQDWYVETMDNMSFSAFIYPENEEEVLNDLQHAFRSQR